MAIGVKVYGTENGESVLRGSIFLDGHKIKPSDSACKSLLYIIGRPAAGPQSGMEPITWQKDPLAWLNNLHYEYRGQALAASTVQELDQPEYPTHTS